MIERLRVSEIDDDAAKDGQVRIWANANNVEIAYTPTNSSWLNRIEAQCRPGKRCLDAGTRT